eukprot:1152654-Pelagomonas_calceolata.AAC.1
MEPAQQGFHVYEEEEGGEVGSRTLECASWYKFFTVSMASVGKPRSYMIQSRLSWSVVLKAEGKEWQRSSCYDSIGAAGGASSLIRRTGVKEAVPGNVYVIESECGSNYSQFSSSN